MQLNPGSGYVHHWYAHSLESQGRLEEAMKEMRAALDLDPLSIPIYWDIGSELLCAGRYDDALRHMRKATDLFPNVPTISYMLAEAYFAKNDNAAAHRILESMKASQPELTNDPSFIGFFGVDAFHQGRRGEARQALDRLEQLHQKQYVEPFMVIELCSLLNGEGDLFGLVDNQDIQFGPASHQPQT